MCILFSALVVLISYTKGAEIKFEKPKHRTVLFMKSGPPVATTDTLVFVGKVEKYVFLYDKVQNASEIYSVDEIKSVRYSRTSKETLGFLSPL